jgi:hypothetical protein
LRANPSLVNCCTCDWFSEWPTDALEAVAMKQLKEMDLDSPTRKTLVGLCQAMHVQVGYLLCTKLALLDRSGLLFAETVCCAWWGQPMMSIAVCC